LKFKGKNNIIKINGKYINSRPLSKTVRFNVLKVKKADTKSKKFEKF